MRPKYPNSIDIRMTDNLLKEIKQFLGLRHMLGSLVGDDTDGFLLEIVKYFDNNDESGPIFLRSIKEARAEKEKEK